MIFVPASLNKASIVSLDVSTFAGIFFRVLASSKIECIDELFDVLLKKLFDKVERFDESFRLFNLLMKKPLESRVF